MNTADTVRQVKIDVVDLKTKFKNAVSGLDEAARDITVTDINVLHDLTTLREPYESPGSPTSPQAGINVINNDDARRNYAEALRVSPTPTSRIGGRTRMNVMTGESRGGAGRVEVSVGRRGVMESRRSLVDDDVIVGGSRSDAATSGINLRSGTGREKTDAAGGEESSGLVRSATTTGRNIVAGVAGDDSWIEKRSRKEQGNDGWTLVKGRKRNLDYQRKVTTGVRGSKKSDGLSFKGATRSIDVFIGRVDNDATEKDLTDYIKDVFKIEVIALSKLNIRSFDHQAFKVTVKLSEREKLFNEELWPEDIVVDKFLNRFRGPDTQASK
ncbi:hypothetical protein Pcinc_001614 [Petrolisthes cinctipes]|uniref:Uncharacterized protein n=1 Tax=Petrolisthes cinctipes TaxID=88211 RepID=A0AAE1L329_PETCI|nr:hypothetical protein Pcinc_007409 [Petrolisthes cinctipes]KAK3894636.1 hypothetical protein Pcinc_001614 [Petrolisthes cinctipes]